MNTSPPTRARIMQILRQSHGATLTDLRREIGISPSALRHQLTVLERDGRVHTSLIRGRPGRPPIIYQPAAAAGPAFEKSFAALLSAVFMTMEEQASDRFGQMLEEIAHPLAVQHGHVARIPSAEARIRAALAILFDVTVEADVTGGGREYEVILRACSLVPVAREFPRLCGITRRLLGTLVGAEVTQQESIVRGDPRCRFRLVLPAAVN